MLWNREFSNLLHFTHQITQVWIDLNEEYIKWHFKKIDHFIEFLFYRMKYFAILSIFGEFNP